jgi:hypothetical protein
MKPAGLWVTALLAALAIVAAPVPVGARPAAPRVLAAGPRADPFDRPGGGFLRTTFSPDGDGRRDRVWIRVRSTPGDRILLRVVRESHGGSFVAGEQTVPAGAGTLSWNGTDVDGSPQPDLSYILEACSAVTGRCASTRVLAHLRILSLYVPRVTAVSVGQTVPAVLATDRLGPFTLDLTLDGSSDAPGVGALVVQRPGRIAYRIPDVAGGLWLLRVRSGSVVTHFPLVVHQADRPLSEPPHGTALVVYPYLTWRAYDRSDLNRDGQLDTWYSHPLRPVIPLRGPFEPGRLEPGLSGRPASPGGEQAFGLWMRLHHLTAQHVTDIELGRLPADVLRRYAVVVFPGHTEYYERRTYDRLLAYRDAGGRLYFLQGNSFYGEVRVGRTSITRLSYRYRTRTQSDFRLAATGFRSCCWPRTIVPRYHLARSVRERLPWLLEGTELRAGDAFGVAVREVDTVDPKLSPRGTIRVASAIVPPFSSPIEGGAAAWIGTRRIPYEPASNRRQRIDIAYAATGPGEVFSWGNVGFMQSLRYKTLPPPELAALDRVALNIWRRFTR